MDKLICLVGESGTGKTTIAQMLEIKGYNIIKSYTTRPARAKDEWGHIFVNKAPVTFDNMIAYTYFDKHHYWAIAEQYKDKGLTIYTIDPDGVEALYERVHDAKIIVIYLKADEKVRYDRMLAREDYPNCSGPVCEIIRRKANQRIEHDRKAFHVFQADYVVDANRTEIEVLQDVLKIILGDEK